MENRPQLVKLAISVVIDLAANTHMRTEDLLVEVRAGGTVRDLIEAIVRFKGLPADRGYGLLRTMIRVQGMNPDEGSRYLPDDLPLADCGLLDGVTLELAERGRRKATELSIDRARRGDDLYLIDERGTHRGRVTRLADGEPVLIGLMPPDDGYGRAVLVDDVIAAPHALTLTNEGGQMVRCGILQRDGLYLAGAPVTERQALLLPGSTISFRRRSDDTDFVTFVIATAAALHGSSPVGRVQYDVTTRRTVPSYPELGEQGARVQKRPDEPERRSFPWEQVAIPIAIVVALYLATHNALTMLVSPLAALGIIINHRRQQGQDKKRYAQARAKWVKSLEETDRQLGEAVGKEEGNLRAENPPSEVWALRAYRRLAGLWERDAREPDFLHARLGLGELPSRYESRIEDGTELREDPDYQRIMMLPGRAAGLDAVRPKLLQVPFVIDLREYHLGLVGSLDVVDAVATNVLLQIACAHPPGAVGIAVLLPAAPQARDGYDWLKWLPHTRSGSTLLPAARMLAGREACAMFLLEMQRLHAERRKHRADEEPDSYALLVVHEAAEVDLALLTEVCDLADGLVRVMWLGSSTDTTPKLVSCAVRVSDDQPGATDGAVGGTDRKPAEGQAASGQAEGGEAGGRFESGPDAYTGLKFDLDLFKVPPLQTARALAGLYDPRSAGTNAGVPQAVPLAAIAELEHIAYRDRPELWLAETFPIPMGVGESGTLDLDLIRHGPHVLIGGTTGSGKSELLQTITCGTISRYSPDEVSLFLVDFKGGATFAPFKDLPHVVGYITDLDQLNVNRALDFLRAELRRREQCFQELGDAKEYKDYLRRARKAQRTDILPRLIVMFDEFATIVQEFERDTINAVIDIARRGRSWGVHLILATQQPTRDVVVPQVRGNVNARIALRTPSLDESQTIIDRPDAAHIPQDFPGRALMTLGGNRLVEFQTAFSGAPFVPQDQQERVAVSRFNITAQTVDADSRAVDETYDEDDGEGAGQSEGDTQKQLEALVAAVAGLGRPRSEGSRQLPRALEDNPVRPAPTATTHETGSAPMPTVLRLGKRDLPKQQYQDDLIADLGKGGLCVTGPNQSGVTTALVRAAEAFTRQLPSGSRITVICFDGADRLREEIDARFENAVTLPLTRLDNVTRTIDQLWERIRARLERGANGTDAAADQPMYLLLIDGCDRLLAGLGGSRAIQWASRLTDILTLGRRVGVYACVTARRLKDLDSVIVASMGTIIALHEHYEAMGTAQENRLPGFGLDPDGHLVQIYIPQPPPAAEGRTVLDARIATSFAPDGWRRAEATPPVRLGPADADRDIVVGLGVEELFHYPYPVWLAESSLMIIGGPRSGRTRLLLSLADQIAAQRGMPVAFLSPRGLPNGVMPANLRVLTSAELASIKMASPDQRAARLADLGVAHLKDGRLLVLVDDLHAVTFMEGGDTAGNALIDFYKQSRIQVIAAVTANDSGTGVGREMKSGGITVYLKPKADPSDYDVGQKTRGTALRHRPGMSYQAGDVIIQSDERQDVAHIPELRETGAPG